MHPAQYLRLWDVVDDTIISTDGCFIRGLRLRGLDSEHIDAETLLQSAQSLYADLKVEHADHTFIQLILESHSDYADILDCHQQTVPSNPVLGLQRQRRVEFLRQAGLRRQELFLFCGDARPLSSKEFAQVAAKAHAERVARAREVQETVAKSLRRAGVASTELTTNEILELYYRALNPGARFPGIEREVGKLSEADLKAHPRLRCLSVREQLLHSELGWSDRHVALGGTICKVLTLKQLPPETEFTFMEVFNQIPMEFRLSVNLLYPDQDKIQRSFQQARRIAHARAHKNKYVEHHEGLTKYAEAQSLSEELADTKQKLVLAGAQVVLSARTWLDLQEKVSRFQQIMKDRRTFFFEETLAHDRELFKTLPGMGVRFDRHKVVTTNNAVDLLPLFNASTGDRDPVMLMQTTNNQLYAYNPVERVRDNWNATVFGASGSGKSVIMNMLITNAMLGGRNKGRLIVVDFAGAQKSSYLMVCQLLGGRFIPFFGDGGARINPFPAAREALNPDGTLKASTLSFLLVLTDILLANEGDDKDSHLFRVILQRAITEAYSGCKPDEAPRYQNLLDILRGYQSSPTGEADGPRLRILVELLAGFLASPSAELFNSPTSMQANEPFVVFDLFGIDSLPKNVAQAVTFVVCERVKRLAFDDTDSHYKYIVLDEVAQLIKRPAMVSLFDELYSTSRKHNTSVWTVTQSYGSYVNSSLAGTVKLNSTTLILLSHARDARARDRIVEDFDLNPREAALFRSLRTIKGEFSELLLKTEVFDPEEGKRATCAKLRMCLSPFDYQMATSDALDRERQRKFIDANPGVPLVNILEHVARVA